jgi:hypothetical protein
MDGEGLTYMGLDDEPCDTAYCPSVYRTFLPSHQHHNLINPTNQVLHMVSCHLDGLSPIKISAKASMPSCNPQLPLQYPHIIAVAAMLRVLVL